ncbi:hypothetical protein R1flu_016998 [Riccia fluitans]|uniref:Uncharacterized protein n=1 Tax=Riccia fluitans TaxID=41844 RepID=A0ABD1YNF8_9MARC
MIIQFTISLLTFFPTENCPPRTAVLYGRVICHVGHSFEFAECLDLAYGIEVVFTLPVIERTVTQNGSRRSCKVGYSEHQACPRRIPTVFIFDRRLKSHASLSFHKTLNKAARFVEQRGVYSLVAEPSGRAVFHVMGNPKGNRHYFCFADHFCSCQASST